MKQCPIALGTKVKTPQVLEMIRDVPTSLALGLDKMDRRLSNQKRILLYGLLLALWAGTIVLQLTAGGNVAVVSATPDIPLGEYRPVMDTTLHQSNKEKP
ncbi:hypothetical protein [Echinicola rosea]|uniref:hypothetical protein n=1 Tax=Echinicola rosea TaxID=1807691 RepID=UPI0010CA92F5|nr:hypothetical protein [Echinicola rosea]